MPPFLLGAEYGDARMGISRVLGVCAALLFASSVTAANIIDLGPSDYRNFGPNGAHTSVGIRSSTGQTVRMPPTLGKLTVTRNPVIPYGSVANGLRNFVRINPASVAASAAVTGLFLAVDWAWDELTQEWVKYEYECPVGTICGIDGNFDVRTMCGRHSYALTSLGEIRTVTASEPFLFSGRTYPSGTVVSVEVIPSSQLGTDPRGFLANCVDRYPEGQWASPPNPFPVLVGAIVTEVGVPELVPYPADFSELEAQLPALPPGQVAEAAGDTQRRIGNPLPGYQDQTISGPPSVSGPETTSTSTDPVTGDTVVTSSTTTTNISYGDTSITTTNTTVTNTYTNGQHSGSETITETPGELPVSSDGGGSSGDWPGFCDWATVVCDWLNWTQEEPPPDVDLPQVIDDDFFNEKTISFGAKSCPPDHEINLAPFLQTAVGVSFQPLCDFAGLIYYMVMAASYIIAAYISIGVARNG